MGGVLSEARHVAHWLRRISVLSGDRVGLIVEARFVDGTTEITTSTTVGEVAVGALETALEVDPFADASGGTNGTVTNLLASRSARANTSIPHTITRSRVAGSFIVETETALETASLRGIVVDASS